jgi:type IV fimbrial biogenesis protein FimT
MNKQYGFTLIELIITVTIVAIVLTIGVPSFQGMMRNNRVAAHTNDFLSSLNLARSEAIKSGWRVVLCPSTDQATCNGGTAWGNGWIVFIDADANNNGILDQASDDNGTRDIGAGNPPNEFILRVHEQLAGNDTLVGNGPVSTYISFAPDGSTRVAGGNAFQAGTLTFGLCNSNNEQNTIVINSVGRVRVVPQSCP